MPKVKVLSGRSFPRYVLRDTKNPQGPAEPAEPAQVRGLARDALEGTPQGETRP